MGPPPPLPAWSAAATQFDDAIRRRDEQPGKRGCSAAHRNAHPLGDRQADRRRTKRTTTSSCHLRWGHRPRSGSWPLPHRNEATFSGAAARIEGAEHLVADGNQPRGVGSVTARPRVPESVSHARYATIFDNRLQLIAAPAAIVAPVPIVGFIGFPRCRRPSSVYSVRHSGDLPEMFQTVAKPSPWQGVGPF